MPGGDRCACGQLGCLDVYASAAGLTRRYAALTGRSVTAHELVATAFRDPAAERVWQDAISALATACTVLTMQQDPSVIAFAGGLAEAGDALLDPLTAAVAAALAWRATEDTHMALNQQASLLVNGDPYSIRASIDLGLTPVVVHGPKLHEWGFI